MPNLEVSLGYMLIVQYNIYVNKIIVTKCFVFGLKTDVQLYNYILLKFLATKLILVYVPACDIRAEQDIWLHHLRNSNTSSTSSPGYF